MKAWNEAREAWARDAGVTEGRARAAAAALLLIGGVKAFQIAVAAWQIELLADARAGSFARESLELSDQLSAAGAVAQLVLVGITALLFLSWLSRTVRAARAVSTTPIRWSPSDAVWGFIIPFVSFVRPYQVIRDLHDQLDPGGVPEPAPRPRLDGSGGYRSVAVERAPPPRTLPHASIGAWWGLFIAAQLIGRTSGYAESGAAELQTSLRVGIVAEVIAVGAALLAVSVVRAVQGRLAERFRRVTNASDEELEAWEIGL
jgi:Domain of unknown function (DUF4328)